MSRLNDVLGVEDGKYFTVENSERRFKLNHNKIHEYTSFGGLMIPPDMDTLIWLIENAEKIKIIPTKPKLTEQQVTAIKGRIAEGWKYIVRESDDEIVFFDLKPKFDKRSGYFEPTGDCNIATLPIYEFLNPSDCFYLPYLIEEGEE